MPAAMRWSSSIRAVTAACGKEKMASLRNLSVRRRKHAKDKSRLRPAEDFLTVESRRQSAYSDSFHPDSTVRHRQPRNRFRRSFSVTQATVLAEINGECRETDGVFLAVTTLILTELLCTNSVASTPFVEEVDAVKSLPHTVSDV